MLYLSPYQLKDLAEIFPGLFGIKLLVCNAGFHAVYIDEHKQSKQLECLNGKASIDEILKVVEKNKLNLYEYEIESSEVSIKTGAVADNDVLINFFEKRTKKLFLQKVLDKWCLARNHKYKTIDDFSSGILYDVSEDIPKTVYTTDNSNNLTCFLGEEMNDECCNKGEWRIKERMYHF